MGKRKDIRALPSVRSLQNLFRYNPESGDFNTKLAKNNRSGVKGVCWESGRRKWRAVITSSGDTIRLGRFDTVAEAKAAISIAREKMHGEFARAA